jgi:hypothetical protein
VKDGGDEGREEGPANREALVVRGTCDRASAPARFLPAAGRGKRPERVVNGRFFSGGSAPLPIVRRSAGRSFATDSCFRFAEEESPFSRTCFAAGIR